MKFVPQITFIFRLLILSNFHSPSKIKDYSANRTLSNDVNASSETQPIVKVNSVKGRGNTVKCSCLRSPETTQLC